MYPHLVSLLLPPLPSLSPALCASVLYGQEWSGLTRRQMGRLNSAPLVLNVARKELEHGFKRFQHLQLEGLQEEGGVMRAVFLCPVEWNCAVG
jgi:hypothetical protein